MGPPPPPPPPPPARTVEVLTLAPEPRDLDVRNGELFWSEQSDQPIRRMPVAGGTPVAVARMSSSYGLGVAGASVYRMDTRYDAHGTRTGAVVVRAPLDGSGREELGVLTAGPMVAAVRMRGTHVLAAVCPSFTACTLRVVSVDGAPEVDLASVDAWITYLDLDDTHAYWLEDGPMGAQALVRSPLSGGARQVILAPASGSFLGAFAVAGADVVFSEVDTRIAVPIAEGTLRRVARIPAGGGARETLGERRGDGGVRELVVAGSEILWRDDTGVFSTPLAGGSTAAPPAADLPPSYAYDSILAADGTIYCTASSRLYATPGLVAPLAGGAIAGPVSLPRLFAADATHLYWHQRSGLLARAPSSGGPVEHLAGGFAGRPGIVVAGDRILGATDWIVQAVGLGGGIAEEAFLADDTIERLAASDDGFFAFTVRGDVWRVPAAGEAARISRFGPLSGRVAAAGGHVYWAEYEPPPSMGVSIFRVPATGGGREVVASGLAGVEDLVVHGDAVFFKELAGAIRRVPVTGGPSTPLTGVMTGPMRLATDDTHLYAANDTVVVKVPLAGGPVDTLLSTQLIGPNSLAVDGTSVYWSDTYWEAIFRLSPK